MGRHSALPEICFGHHHAQASDENNALTSPGCLEAQEKALAFTRITLKSQKMGSQHPSPKVKTLCNVETQIWLEMITSRDAKSACHVERYFLALLGQIWREKITSRDGCFLLRKVLQSESSGREPESGKFPKVVRRGCKRSFEPKDRKWGCTSAKWAVQNGFGWCKRLLGPFCSLSSNYLLHPLLTTFGNLPFSGSLSQNFRTARQVSKRVILGKSKSTV